MTPSELPLLRATLQIVARNPNRGAAVFFDHVLTLAPVLREVVPAGSEPRGAAFMRLLTTSVEGLARPDLMAEPMRALSRRCNPQRVDCKLYAGIGQALLSALAVALGPAFTEEARTAWADGYVQLAEMMMATNYNRLDLVA